jgi:hypothetical protein
MVVEEEDESSAKITVSTKATALEEDTRQLLGIWNSTSHLIEILMPP